VSANDAGDGDAGPNNQQNFPQLTSATSGSTVVAGTLNSAPDTQFRIEFFANTACDPSGYGEGETYIGYTTVMTGPSGDADIDVTLPATVPVGDFVTSTATDPAGNTSEFSECIAVTPGATATPTPTPTPTTSGSPTASASATSTPTPTGQTPTPTATPTATPGSVTPTATGGTSTSTASVTPTPSGEPELLQGDVNCDGDVDEDDFAFLMEFAAGLNDGTQPDPCPDLNEALPAGTNGHPWGDVNCDGDVNALDALYVLAHKAGIELEQPQGCTAIGSPLT